MDQQRLKRVLTSDAFFIGMAIAVILLMGLPRIGMAGLWDEPKVYLKPLFALYEDFVGYFAAPLTPTHRPPGIHFLYLPFLWAFGPAMEVIRILDLIYFSIGLFCFYKVTAGEDRFIAKLTLVFVLLTPIFQVYSVQYVAEPQLFALISVYLYLLTYHAERLAVIFCFGIFLGLVRETTLALIPATMAMLYLRGAGRKKFFWLTGPFIGFAIYGAFTYYKTGGLISHHDINQGNIDLFRDLSSRIWKCWQTLLAPYRLIPLMATSLICFLKFKNWKRPSPLTAFCLVLGVSYVFVFSGHAHGIPRYFYAVFPFLVYFFLRPLRAFSKTTGLSVAAIVLIVLPPLLIGNPTREENPPFYAFQGYQDTWDHQEILKLHLEAVSQIKANIPAGSLVMTAWPFLEILRLDYGGYGRRVEYRLTSKPEAGELPDVILYTNYPRSFPVATLEEFVKSGNYRERVFSFRNYQLRLFEKKSMIGP